MVVRERIAAPQASSVGKSQGSISNKKKSNTRNSTNGRTNGRKSNKQHVDFIKLGSASSSRAEPNSHSRNREGSTRPLEDIKSLDWAKFTHFRARNTVADLERLCAGDGGRAGNLQTRRPNVFSSSKPDKAGLWPIHWAAINNRSDMIEFMLANGARANKRCANRLFSNGTPLHLAAMNGSLEAAAMLLSKGSTGTSGGNQSNQRSEQTGANLDGGTSGNTDREARRERNGCSTINEMLNERDAEGQTPLMRSAPSRSKRMDTIKDLLRKNFWSLSGRPAEMALYLICNGADWKQTEPINGMNLMHLAIANDYDDIVSLLLVLDKGLLEVAACGPKDTKEATSPGQSKRQAFNGNKKGGQSMVAKQAEAPRVNGFETVTLEGRAKKDEVRASSLKTDYHDDDDSSSSLVQREPLISSRDKANEIVARGLKPLELAILYGRVRIISLLWNAKVKDPNQSGSELDRSDEREKIINEYDDNLGKQRRAVREHSNSNKELKMILIRACWSNRDELAKFLKSILLKGSLMLDLGLLVLLWAPIYAASSQLDRSVLLGLKGGVFLISCCISMAIAFRVMLKNPGYLRRNSVQYLAELSKLTAMARNKNSENGGGPALKETKNRTSGASSQITIVQPPSESAAPLIKLHSASPTAPEQTQPDTSRPVTHDEEQVNLGKNSNPRTTTNKGTQEATNKLVVLPQAPNWQAQFDVKDTVRLLCHKCQCIRRPRSRHCDHCNHCVQDFDHHCIYLGCCIGRHNRLDFLLALIALSITSIYGTIIHSSSLAHSEWSSFWHLLGFLWVFKFVLIGAWCSFQNLRRACLGVTLYEEIRSKRIRHLFGRYGPPESISKSHRGLSTLKGSYWRYAPDRFITGELSSSKIWSNYREFANFISADEYLLTYICTDTPLARSLTSSDARINLYKIA